MKRKAFYIIFLGFLLMMNRAIANTISVYDEATLRQAVENAADGDEAIVHGTIELTSPLTIEKKLTLSGEKIQLADSWQVTGKPVITIAESASLLIDGITLDGNDGSSILRGYNGNSPFLFVLGEMTLKSGAIQNINSAEASSQGGIIHVGDGGAFSMTGGEIKNNRFTDGYYHGIVTIDEGGNFNMSGGSIHDNAFKDEDDPYFNSGVVYVHSGANFNMSGSAAIENNDMVGICLGELAATPNNPAVFTMDGGYIRNNDLFSGKDAYEGLTEQQFINFYQWGYLYGDAIGGGVKLQGTSQFTMNGGEISHNSAIMGGGVAVFPTYGAEASFVMNGGKISENDAFVGGGLYVSGHEGARGLETVSLIGGAFKGNTARAQGGGIYASQGFTVHLQNVVIHDNTASVMGGGVWSCPTANVFNLITNGAAIYHNTAGTNNSDSQAAAADIASVPKSSGHSTFLSERTLGGGKAAYYQDGLINGSGEYNVPGLVRYVLGVVSEDSTRYDSENPGTAVTGIYNDKNSQALVSEFLDDSIQLAEAKAKLEITDNKAERGGGIGTNGNIIIGTNPDGTIPTSVTEIVSELEHKLVVEKQWDGDAPAEWEVVIHLLAHYEGKTYEVDHITLTRERPNAIISGLPAGEYSVLEDPIDGYITSYQVQGVENAKSVVLDANNKEGKITVRNTSLIEICGTKTWMDGGKEHNNAAEIELVLKRTSAKAGEETVTAAPAWNGNTYTYSNLPKYDSEGNEYTYTVSETPITGYTIARTGNDFTNTITGTVEVTGTKTWVDGGKEHNNAAEIELVLKRTSAKAGEETVTATPAWNSNTYTYSNLPKYDSEGNEYTYTVSETPITGYTIARTGNNFTNTITGTVEVTGTKTWVDGGKEHNNAAEIELVLKRTSAKAGEETVTAAPAWNGNTYTYSNLPKYDKEGYEYTYTASETPITGYTIARTGNDFTNTITGTVEVKGTKTWVDGGKEHNNAAEIELVLKRTSAKAGEETVTEAPDWNGNTYTYSNLPKYDKEGYEYTYTVSETPITGYTIARTGNDFTNTITGTVEVKGTKTWVDGGKEHNNAAEIELVLKRTSAKAGEETVTEAPDWNGNTYTYSNLPKYDGEGYEYTYSVAEEPVAGYAVEQEGNDFTNTLQIVTIDPPVEKKVSGENAPEAVFTFQMTGEQDAPMPEGSTDGQKTIEQNGPGKVEFGEIEYTEPGEWQYEIREIPGDTEGYQYDDTVWQLTVKVSAAQDGLVAEVTAAAEGKTAETAVFENVYAVAETTTPPTEAPDETDEPEPTETPTPKPTEKPEPVIPPEPTWTPNEFYFSFTKSWRGTPQDSISFTLHNPNGTVKQHRFNQRKISDTEWLYEAWLSSAADYYVVENPVEGYTTAYVNVGEHAGEKDRVYNGGTIINYDIPKTGDTAYPAFWMAMAAIGLCGIGMLVFDHRKKHLDKTAQR